MIFKKLCQGLKFTYPSGENGYKIVVFARAKRKVLLDSSKV